LSDGVAQAEKYLLTKYVFVDTEAFRRAQYDWDGKVLSKLARFAKDGHVRLLITDITIREVCSQLGEWKAEAMNAVRKYEVVFGQLQESGAVATLSDPGALPKLEAAFAHFLRVTKAIDVPIVTSVNEILLDYFARRPPFSSKKKAEFPDAIVIASLRAWCEERKAKAYVVSADQDMEACCSSSGPLLYAKSITDIISQATVSKELHDALERALFNSEALEDLLSEQLRRLTVVRGDMRLRDLTGEVQDVGDIQVLSVNVLDRDEMTFTCEIEFEAGLALRLEIEHEEDYEPRFQRTARSIYRIFGAEVVVRFDPKNPSAVEFESVYVPKAPVELSVKD